MLCEADRAHLLRIVVGLQVKAWACGARDLPPLQVGAEPLDHYSRTWTTLQIVCTRALEQIASSAGLSVSNYVVQEFASVLELVMPVCLQHAAELQLALLEVCVRQADVDSLAAMPGSFETVMPHLRRLIMGKGTGTGDDGGDDWVVVEGEGQEAHKNKVEGLTHVQVDALVLLVHLLSDPAAVAPWHARLSPSVIDVLALAHRAARASLAAEAMTAETGLACGAQTAAAACAAVAASVSPGTGCAEDGGKEEKSRALAIASDEVSSSTPAITVVNVNLQESPAEPSAVDGAVVCQTALEAVYLALVPEMRTSVCLGGVMSAVEALVVDALLLPQGNIRQLTCLLVSACADCASAGGGLKFSDPDRLAEALLARVDDSQNDVRVEALNALAAVQGMLAASGQGPRGGGSCSAGVLAGIERRVGELVEDGGEVDDVSEAASALADVLATRRPRQ